MLFRLRGASGGQATVELALCLPALAFVLAALVEIALIGCDQVRLWHAAREAARSAVVDPDRSAALAAAERSGLDGLEMSISPDPGQRVQGRALTVSLSYTPEGHVPLVGRLFAAFDLSAEASMRIETP